MNNFLGSQNTGTSPRTPEGAWRVVQPVLEEVAVQKVIDLRILDEEPGHAVEELPVEAVHLPPEPGPSHPGLDPAGDEPGGELDPNILFARQLSTKLYTADILATKNLFYDHPVGLRRSPRNILVIINHLSSDDPPLQVLHGGRVVSFLGHEEVDHQRVPGARDVGPVGEAHLLGKGQGLLVGRRRELGELLDVQGPGAGRGEGQNQEQGCGRDDVCCFLQSFGFHHRIPFLQSSLPASII